MAEKKSSSRAEKVVSNAKKKGTDSTSSKTVSKKKAASAKKAAEKKPPKVKTEYEGAIPDNFVAAIVCILLFALFAVMCFNAEGALLQVVKSAIVGLIGQAAFYFSVPALLYLFVIYAFNRRKRVRLRSFCVISFVFLCGALFHMIVYRPIVAEGFDILVNLYQSGNLGRSGGVICGGAAMLLQWACGSVLTYLILILCAVLALLGAMEITIPSLIRAIANRPRDDWEEDEDEYVEPAVAVVNHIANKKIEQKRLKRERAQLEAEQTFVYNDDYEDLQPVQAPVPKLPKPAQPKKAEKTPERQISSAQDTVKQIPGKGSAFMDRIDMDINAPLSGTSDYIREDTPSVFDDPVTVTPKSVPVEEEIFPEMPRQMPPLEVDRPSKKAEKIPANVPVKNSPESGTDKVSSKDAAESAKKVAAEIAQAQAVAKPEYCFPPIDLLKRPARGAADGTEEMRENSRRLNETLASFNIDAHIINVTRGPSVTRYEVELDKGVRLNKLTGCADDIALSLGASGVRIAAVPGKISVVGIEVPNRTVTTVSLREVLDSNEFTGAKSKSSIGLGKSIDGNCVVGNIAKMPHLLIAGTTGSGKSVCMNSIIISLLYKAGPEDVKLIMVDPKMVELGIYNGIPHLLIPVVTDPKKAAGSLQWAVTEMLRRYKMMSDMGVRDLESYNSIVTAEEDGQKLPQVVIIIDELADLMMVAAKEVEDSICRIAQMGRAAGMHLIIATQRPSANVITGLMKANIPSRIAFSVASAMESRIILDTMGAEKLVGKGDMLYAPIGSGKPLRVQGCFVTDGEVEAVAEYVKENYLADYNQEVLEEIEKKAQQAGTGKKASASEPEPNDEELDGDEMLPAAVDVILETGQASVSMLQRRLKLGYARAARIVDEMEEKGIVGPFQGSKPRAILITKDQWEARKGGNTQMEFDDLEDFGGVPEEI